RMALEWSINGPDPSYALRLCTALSRYWTMRSYFSEARDWCARALERDVESTPSAARAATHNVAGQLAYYQAECVIARDHHLQALDISRLLDDRNGIAASLSALGNVADDRGEFALARDYHDECLAIRRELGDELGIASALNNLGNVAYHIRDYESAKT